MHRYRSIPSLIALILIASSLSSHADEIEFLSGSKIKGTVTKIDKAGRKVTFDVTNGNRNTSRVYPYSRIHAVVYRGKRYILTPKPEPNAPATEVAQIERSKQEVMDVINSVGASKPDWFDQTPVRVPRTLDLSWPNPPNKQWDSRKYPGQYVWDVINPNEHRWKEGVRLLHHIVAVNKNNRQAQVKAMNQLGTLYASLLEYWPRAAYWWHKAGKGIPGVAGVGGFRVGYQNGLAKCYWKLGNRDMAVQMLSRFREASCYLWCEMGDFDRALRQAEMDRKGWRKEQALVRCGDVCRRAGWHDKALDYYKQAAALPKIDKYKRTIPEALDRIAALQAQQGIDLANLRDGKYKGTALGYSGTLEVTAIVHNHRIQSVKVSKHVEKQYYSSLTDIPNQILQKQSVQGVDATSSATMTAEAIVSATAKALGK